MIHARRTLFPTVAFVLLFAGPALAQTPCTLADTIQTCWDRYNDTAEPAAADAAVAGRAEVAGAEIATEVPKKATGVDTGGLNLASTTKNFLPLFVFAGLLSGSGDASSGDTAVFDVNLPFLNTQQRRNLKVRLLADTDPQVSEAVKMKLPEDERDALTKSLGEGLSDVDDLAVSLTYNWEDATHGRSFKLYRKRFGTLARAALMPISTDRANAANKTLIALVTRDLPNSTQSFQNWTRNDPNDPNKRVALSDLEKMAALHETEAAAKAAADLDASFSRALRTAGLDKFAALVANQPQLHVEAKLRSRDPVVGGDETSAKVTYEWSSINLNGALSDASCRDHEEEVSECLEAYQQYITTYGHAIDRGLRVAFSGEYVDIDDQRIDLSASALEPILIEGSSKVIVAFSVSGNWTGAGEAGEPARVDFEAKWEDVSDDPMRQDRAVATLTVTKKIGNLSVPLGLVYANRSEFLTGVDEELSAHVGLSFDFLSK